MRCETTFLTSSAEEPYRITLARIAVVAMWADALVDVLVNICREDAFDLWTIDELTINCIKKSNTILDHLSTAPLHRLHILLL